MAETITLVLVYEPTTEGRLLADAAMMLGAAAAQAARTGRLCASGYRLGADWRSLLTPTATTGDSPPPSDGAGRML